MNLKENCSSVKLLLQALKFMKNGWRGYGDLKIVAFLVEIYGGFIKFSCSVCSLDNEDTTAHYHNKHWPERTELCLGKHNVKFDSLINLQNELLPLLHKKTRSEKTIC